jgi:hypothetical protein
VPCPKVALRGKPACKKAAVGRFGSGRGSRSKAGESSRVESPTLKPSQREGQGFPLSQPSLYFLYSPTRLGE